MSVSHHLTSCFCCLTDKMTVNNFLNLFKTKKCYLLTVNPDKDSIFKFYIYTVKSSLIHSFYFFICYFYKFYGLQSLSKRKIVSLTYFFKFSLKNFSRNFFEGNRKLIIFFKKCTKKCKMDRHVLILFSIFNHTYYQILDEQIYLYKYMSVKMYILPCSLLISPITSVRFTIFDML